MKDAEMVYGAGGVDANGESYERALTTEEKQEMDSIFDRFTEGRISFRSSPSIIICGKQFLDMMRKQQK